MKLNTKSILAMVALAASLSLVSCGGDTAHEEPAAEEHAAETEVTIDPAIVQMQADCAAAADAMAARQAEQSLYERLGGREAIFTVTGDVIARHRVNPTISHLMEGVDDAHLTKQVTDFLAQAAGGDVEYHGMDMVQAHAALGLTDEHFLAAGSDMQDALMAAGAGEGEIQEVMCMFASLHGDVVRG